MVKMRILLSICLIIVRFRLPSSQSGKGSRDMRLKIATVRMTRLLRGFRSIWMHWKKLVVRAGINYLLEG